jgi:poly(3-hydroxybutyrate) depolymerase
MVDVLVTDYAADPKRLYLSGFSKGAEMVHGLVAHMSTTFAAAHRAAGTNTDSVLPKPARPMSVMYSTSACTTACRNTASATSPQWR